MTTHGGDTGAAGSGNVNPVQQTYVHIGQIEKFVVAWEVFDVIHSRVFQGGNAPLEMLARNFFHEQMEHYIHGDIDTLHLIRWVSERDDIFTLDWHVHLADLVKGGNRKGRITKGKIVCNWEDED